MAETEDVICIGAVLWDVIGRSSASMRVGSDVPGRITRIPGGVAMPDHGHRGTELTLVLQGAFKDEEDRFGRGDIEVANEDLHHTPVAEEGDVCICLAATDAPLRFRGILPRIAQPFIGI